MSHDAPADPLSCALLTVSDRCAAGLAVDESSEALAARLGDFALVARAIVPDEIEAIQRRVRAWSDEQRITLILTTGGTGFAPRDRTPEAIAPLIERPTPGLVVAMLQGGLRATPHAMLSRPVAGIRGQSLIVTLPGSPRGAVESLEALLPALPHGLRLLVARPDEDQRHG